MRYRLSSFRDKIQGDDMSAWLPNGRFRSEPREKTSHLLSTPPCEALQLLRERSYT